MLGTKKIVKLFYQALKIDWVRNQFCWIRFHFMKRNIKTLEEVNNKIGCHTLDHNIAALSNKAAFGMGNRMALLLYPLSAIFRHESQPKILIVGPRTEDDIFWAKSLGMTNVRGLDLFSYSPLIEIGDIHATHYHDSEFDAIILGWVISYSNAPNLLLRECCRILKPSGYLGVGIESNPELRSTGKVMPPRVNNLNSATEIASLIKGSIVFIHDPQLTVATDNAVILKI